MGPQPPCSSDEPCVFVVSFAISVFYDLRRMEARALPLSGKRSTTEPRPQPLRSALESPRSKALGAWLSGRVLAGIFSSSFTSTEEGKRLR